MSEIVKGLLLNTGKQFLAELLAGKYANDKFGMYIEYYNGTPSAPSIVATRNKDYYTNLASPSGYVRVPFVSTAALIGSDYKAVFSGTVLPGYTTSGGSLSSSSKFYSATLVYMPNSASSSTDIPIFVRNFYLGDTFSPVSYVANTNFTATINLALG